MAPVRLLPTGFRAQRRRPGRQKQTEIIPPGWAPTSGPREKSMSDFLIEHTPSAYRYPLLIKHLLHAPMTQSADQEIVYRDLSRYTYRDLRERIGRLAGGLASKGIRRGDVVGVLDWDSHRYLECYFAIPMLGATLQTVQYPAVARAGLVHAQSRASQAAAGERRVSFVDR